MQTSQAMQPPQARRLQAISERAAASFASGIAEFHGASILPRWLCNAARMPPSPPSGWPLHGGTLMLTIDDCIGLSELSEEEVLAIAEHEHIPQIAAIELGNSLIQTPDGEE